MITNILSGLLGIISFAILDYIFLAKILKDFYLRELVSHAHIENGSLVPFLPIVPCIYLLVTVGLMLFVLPKATTVPQAWVWSALFGFIIYGFYDLTNVATFKDYSWSITLVDILWGTFLVGTVGALIFWTQELFR